MLGQVSQFGPTLCNFRYGASGAHRVLRRGLLAQEGLRDRGAGVVVPLACAPTAADRSGDPCQVIHRDLKSPNLLLAQPLPPAADAAGRRDYEPLLKITDFGLARQKVRGPNLKLYRVEPNCEAWPNTLTETPY